MKSILDRFCSGSGRRPRLPPGVVSAALGVQFVTVLSVPAALESGAYATVPGSTVVESGDRVANGSRTVPMAASFTFDLTVPPPIMTGLITDAVLEGGAAFPLTVHSSSGGQFGAGTNWFTGDYLRQIYPSGSQYFFDWTFSTAADGRVVWNGSTYWAGGHLWYVTISNLTLVPVARMSIATAQTGTLRISWATNFADHMLEYTTGLPAPGWSSVTNVAAVTGDRVVVTVDASPGTRFFRLRKRY